MDTKSTKSIYCRECRRDTNHGVLFETKQRSHVHDDDRWSKTHYFAQCAGCNSFCYAIATETEDSWNPHIEEMEPTWNVYPTPEDGVTVMENSHLLPDLVVGIYREVIDALNGRLSLLVAIGLRMLLEAICQECSVSGKNLRARIDGLVSDGLLSTQQVKILHKLRFLGNHAAHEITEPQPGEILAALEIAESLLKTIYVIPHLAQQVSTGQPE